MIIIVIFYVTIIVIKVKYKSREIIRRFDLEVGYSLLLIQYAVI